MCEPVFSSLGEGPLGLTPSIEQTWVVAYVPVVFGRERKHMLVGLLAAISFAFCFCFVLGLLFVFCLLFEV